MAGSSPVNQGDGTPPLPPPVRSSRKSALSMISTDEANDAKMEDTSLTTPADVAVCICLPPPKIPRPRNAFILYRQHHQAEVASRHPGLANPDISKIIGRQWRLEPDEVRNNWNNLADEEKVRHQKQYPNYKYQPKRGGKNANAKEPSSATDDRRCSTCRGRLIAPVKTLLTPRSPSTPSLAVQGQAPPTSHPSFTWDGRREVDEGYEPPSSSPDRKRRRVTNAGAYQQTQHSTAQLTHAVSHHGPHSSHTAPPISQPHRQQPFPGPGTLVSPLTPRSNPYDPPIWGRAPDYSIQLAPIQPDFTGHPPSADASSRHVSPTGVATNRGTDSQAKGVKAMTYLDKIQMLCNISPPLPAARPGGPRTETRGALIAIDGPCPEMLKSVGRAVAKILSDADEVALKMWGGDDPAPLAEGPDGEMRANPGGGTHAKRSQCCVSYLGRVIQWYERSNEIIEHITTQPCPTSGDTIMGAQRTSLKGSTLAGATLRTVTEPAEAPTSAARVPVALVPTGFSLTLTDQFACATPITDSHHFEVYKDKSSEPIAEPIADSCRFNKHWWWMATFWRGIVGPDLFIYVTPASEEEIKESKEGAEVDMRSSGIMVVKIQEGKKVGEKLQRRLAFEVLEWVRAGQYKTKG